MPAPGTAPVAARRPGSLGEDHAIFNLPDSGIHPAAFRSRLQLLLPAGVLRSQWAGLCPGAAAASVQAVAQADMAWKPQQETRSRDLPAVQFSRVVSTARCSAFRSTRGRGDP